MKEITLDLANRSYPIYIGDGLLSNAQPLLSAKLNKQVMVVSNTTIAPLYLKSLQQALSGYQLHPYIIADGEEYKTIQTHGDIISELLTQHFDRTCTLIALGGGVVGDLTGFVAATYQRGVGYIQIPTTLLAQVDSSVGGKTAVNHRYGKNMIGAFYQPLAVLADTSVLATLPDRQFRAGLSEVIKYGCIHDADFFHWLSANIDALNQRHPDAMAYAIERSCLNKAEVVAKDETETGLRAILNLGHTFAHAIETAQNYRDWLHGEAVATGIAMAAELSVRCHLLAVDKKEQIIELLGRARLPVFLPDNVRVEDMREHMSVDKKVTDGSLNLILLNDIGSAVISADFDESALLATIHSFSRS